MSKSNERYSFCHLKSLGDYQLIRPLGIGGMGEVYLARRASGQFIALKLLLPTLANNRRHIELFLKEIALLREIKHPGIVCVLDAGVQDDVCFFAMDYIDGHDLSALINGEAVDEVVALKIIREVAVILRAVFNDYQVIHRDIKPENIMITPDGGVHLLDFGLSLALSSDNEYQCRGIGTVQFSPPEQIAGDTVDLRADIYSLGVTLFQLLTKHFPYDGEVEEIRAAHLNEPVPDPRSYRQEISPFTVEVIKRMMAKDPDERYQSWNEIIMVCDKVLKKMSQKKYFANLALPGLKKNLVALLLALIALLGLVLYSRVEAARKRVERDSARLLKSVETMPEDDCQQKLEALNQLPPDMSKKYLLAVAEAKKILKGRIAERKRREQAVAIENALREIRHKSYNDFEQQKQWVEAQRFWQSQLEHHEFKHESRFVTEVTRYLDFIKQQSK